MMASSKASMSSLAARMKLKSAHDIILPNTIPKLVYGTAWKKERSADLVYQALKQGFRGVDTAAQPRHYQEKLVGDGIRKAIAEGIVKREDLYIQTKFTPLSGQDKDNMPYSIAQSIPERVHSSVASSLANLNTSSNAEDSYIDCLVLHSPMPSLPETYEVWKTLSGYVPNRIRALGISNTDLDTVASLISDMDIPPSIVQNRFYPATHWEVELRKLCHENDIIYQSFWTLSGNPQLLRSSVVENLAKDAGVEREVALYCLVLGLERVCILDGTTNPEHMRGDLAGVEMVGSWADGENKVRWQQALQDFKGVIGQA
ncbi:hypothetical protein BP5796_04606 [Coleophoma crateriformis]|uniref:NADP-dependent oxidoreductase domain-containing protein n=1 Tax=Coleophoma crateriformis TaxID=565419 RepID=A0A3D8S9U5_9HELO|nr:hypothetical protein BP5796_04606 [Coleophoma crateriformis]